MYRFQLSKYVKGDFIMSYSDLIKKIKANPLKYIDEYNIDYLQNYLDGYYFFSFRNGFKDGLLIMS